MGVENYMRSKLTRDVLSIVEHYAGNKPVKVCLSSCNQKIRAASFDKKSFNLVCAILMNAINSNIIVSRA